MGFDTQIQGMEAPGYQRIKGEMHLDEALHTCDLRRLVQIIQGVAEGPFGKTDWLTSLSPRLVLSCK